MVLGAKYGQIEQSPGVAQFFCEILGVVEIRSLTMKRAQNESQYFFSLIESRSYTCDLQHLEKAISHLSLLEDSKEIDQIPT